MEAADCCRDGHELGDMVLVPQPLRVRLLDVRVVGDDLLRSYLAERPGLLQLCVAPEELPPGP